MRRTSPPAGWPSGSPAACSRRDRCDGGRRRRAAALPNAPDIVVFARSAKRRTLAAPTANAVSTPIAPGSGSAGGRPRPRRSPGRRSTPCATRRRRGCSGRRIRPGCCRARCRRGIDASMLSWPTRPRASEPRDLRPAAAAPLHRPRGRQLEAAQRHHLHAHAEQVRVLRAVALLQSAPRMHRTSQGPSHDSSGELNAVALSLRQPIAGTGRAPPSRIRLLIHDGPHWRRSTEA